MAVRRSAPSQRPEPQRVPVPHLNRDPVWSLRIWPVTFAVGGVEFEVPAMSAAEWLTLLMVKTPDVEGLIELVPGLDEAIYTEQVPIQEAYEVLPDVIGAACGRDWWVGLRLIATALDHWDLIGGQMILKGVDPTTISLSAWLDAFLLTLLRSMEDADANRFLLQLESRPPEVHGEPHTEQFEMSAGQFMSMA